MTLFVALALIAWDWALTKFFRRRFSFLAFLSNLLVIAASMFLGRILFSLVERDLINGFTSFSLSLN